MKAAPLAVITGTLLLTVAGCSSSGTLPGRGQMDGGSIGAGPGAGTTTKATGGDRDKTTAAGDKNQPPASTGGDAKSTPKTAVDAFLAAAKNGDTSAVTAATCQDMRDEVVTNLKGLTIQSYTLAAPYQMEDHWVVTANFTVTQNGTPYQGKVDYQVVKESGTYKWCGLDVPFGAPKGTPGIDPASIGG